MDETPRENWSEYLLLAVTVIPAMIANGLMPSWDVLPFGGWMAVATLGGAVAGAIATPLSLRGLVSGLVAGVGIFAGIWLQVALRSWLTAGAAIWRPELVVGALIGWAPGIWLHHAWARPQS
ncbi:hypothetical protein [Paludisphaera soli]|uniref:hypothetical protein n=1 Tax=Paludisphaera soli TaxID=2712865 RepID=UPI0013ED63FC|nr:hypothetical protein [Paludisphaera soli]